MTQEAPSPANLRLAFHQGIGQLFHSANVLSDWEFSTLVRHIPACKPPKSIANHRQIGLSETSK